MTMGLSAALLEQSVVDPRFGHVVTQNFADYHIASNADVGVIDVAWLDEADEHSNPMGSRGIGEIGIVGAAAAIANAAHHATTGIRGARPADHGRPVPLRRKSRAERRPARAVRAGTQFGAAIRSRCCDRVQQHSGGHVRRSCPLG
jgi:hypothetical protein